MNKYILSLWAVAAMFGLQSCGDDETFDVMGNPNTLIYFAPMNSSAQNMPSVAKTFTVITTPVGYFGDEVKAKFGVRSTHPMQGTATVTAAIDNGLVDAYNAAHQTSYMSCTGASMQKASATIPDGQSLSSDSIEVVFPVDQYASMVELGTYLIPVRLTTTTNATLTVKENMAYLIINLKEELINKNATVASITGTLVADRSAWTATSSDNTVIGTTIFDNNTTTYSRFNNAANPTVTIDMQMENKVTALYFNNRYNYYNFSNIAIQLSTDGMTWMDTGYATPVVANSIDQYIIFYGGIPARYIKLSLTWQYGTYGGNYRRIYEMNAYVE